MTLMLESRMPGNWHVRFGGGESEKDQQWHLVGFLSYPVSCYWAMEMLLALSSRYWPRAVPGWNKSWAFARSLAELVRAVQASSSIPLVSQPWS